MEELLKVNNLVAGYGGVKIIRNISFTLKKNEILGIVGESGCGKSTLIKAIAQLEGLNTNVSSGSIAFDKKDLLTLSRESKRKLWGDEISMIFQNPEANLNPSRKIGTQLYETVKSHRQMYESEIDNEAEKILLSIGLTDVKRVLNSYPFELSGGMAQRVAIALAMILKPKLILADEPTSALDTTIQKQVVEEMLTLRKNLQTAMIIITHNIGVVAKMADRIGVMYGGRIIEYGKKEEVLSSPAHPYTKALLAAVPSLGGGLPIGLKGRPPRFNNIDRGCSFCMRCTHSLKACECYDNSIRKINEDHYIICYREDINE